jgi:hypothetical protein
LPQQVKTAAALGRNHWLAWHSKNGYSGDKRSARQYIFQLCHFVKVEDQLITSLSESAARPGACAR